MYHFSNTYSSECLHFSLYSIFIQVRLFYIIYPECRDIFKIQESATDITTKFQTHRLVEMNLYGWNYPAHLNALQPS
jgi:hypothetical protein